MALNLLGHTENLTKTMREGNSQLEQYNDFQLLLVAINQENTIKNTIQTFLNLICPDYIIEITKNSIDFKIGGQSLTKSK